MHRRRRYVHGEEAVAILQQSSLTWPRAGTNQKAMAVFPTTGESDLFELVKQIIL